jgi:hypothetical protein
MRPKLTNTDGSAWKFKFEDEYALSMSFYRCPIPIAQSQIVAQQRAFPYSLHADDAPAAWLNVSTAR